MPMIPALAVVWASEPRILKLIKPFTRFTLEPTETWRSVRTFHDYPTRWKLEIPEARLEMTVEAAFDTRIWFEKSVPFRI